MNTIIKNFDVTKFLDNLQKASFKYTEILNNFASFYKINTVNPLIDFDKIEAINSKIIENYSYNPQNFFEFGINYNKNLTDLYTNTIEKFYNLTQDDLYQESSKDRRFSNKNWRENLYFNFVKQYYLMNSDMLNNFVKEQNFDFKDSEYFSFCLNQFLNALSPTNFIHFNPSAIEEMFKTNGESLINGLDNLISDLNSNNKTIISTVDDQNFKIGENIATCEGKIIFQNELMQLICYKPNNMVQSIPILICPPWINKYYILDLSPHNSFVKWLVDNNYQVFLISWINPNENLNHKNFEDYLQDGILDSINFITKNFAYEKINALGYCLGGTLLSSAMSYLNYHKIDKINSATFLTTLLDFSNPGDIRFFINNSSYSILENISKKKELFYGNYMSNIFSILRANDMIWSFFVNNYLMGKSPPPFDILYWNSDVTNLPIEMHKFYFKNMYLENNLCKSSGINLLGTPINLGNITQPVFLLSAKDDHIVPWKESFKALKLFSGSVKLCLAASGHVAGVINHPLNNKYSYWINNNNLDNLEKWLDNAEELSGSWWTYWNKWQKDLSGTLEKSINYEKLDYIEKAPGSYVKNCNFY